ncbi:MAG: DNA polymerase III subunit delta', partial [Candidatus Competibacteraceae bacterium]|nr:DNA polymerase III subunit delta' [Candidatus Competibacteraceae bacterium]
MEERLPWHQPHWQRLAAGVEAGRLPHALLLSGPSGLGKMLFARQLTQSLLCRQPGENLTFCGKCRGCRLLAAGSHPDITRVEPEEPGKPIKVDRVRQLCAFLGQTARGYKVALLSPAEAMNPSAANALLKTLEEPPPGSLLLLVTAFPARLPATIRSRCQILAFTPPLRTQALEWLSPRVAGFQAGLLLDLTGNAPLAALEQA